MIENLNHRKKLILTIFMFFLSHSFVLFNCLTKYKLCVFFYALQTAKILKLAKIGKKPFLLSMYIVSQAPFYAPLCSLI